MRIDLMKEFCMLIDMMNFTKAAAALHISQPTLSKHMKELETETGLKLFDRDEANVQLTPAGMEFLKYMTRILSLYETALRECHTIQSRGRMSLKLHEAPVRTFMTPLYRLAKRYESQNPYVTYDFTGIWNHADVFSALDEGAVDVALDVRFCHFDKEDRLARIRQLGYHVLELPSEPLVLWFMKTHPFARKERITLDDLMETTLVTASGLTFDTLKIAILALFEQIGAVPQFEARQIPHRSATSSYFLSNFGDSVFLSTSGLIGDARLDARDDVMWHVADDPRLLMTPFLIARADDQLACGLLRYGGEILDEIAPRGTSGTSPAEARSEINRG